MTPTPPFFFFSFCPPFETNLFCMFLPFSSCHTQPLTTCFTLLSSSAFPASPFNRCSSLQGSYPDFLPGEHPNGMCSCSFFFSLIPSFHHMFGDYLPFATLRSHELNGPIAFLSSKAVFPPPCSDEAIVFFFFFYNAPFCPFLWKYV